MKLGRVVATVLLLCAAARGQDWPQFRGPRATSVATGEARPALEEGTEQIAWVAELPGRGPSSPIVVGDRVFITSSWGTPQDRLCVLAFDADTGTELWRREFWATGRTLCHPMSSMAAPTPASDGQRVFAFYSSNDLVCLDRDGNLQWYRGLAYDWPKAGNDAGMASSPAVAGDTVIVQIENQNESFAIGLDVAVGETRWRIARDPIASWCTPVVLPAAAGQPPVVVLQSSAQLTAHDARTGRQLWRFAGGCSTISSLVADEKRIFVPASGMTALDVASATEPEEIWQSNRLGLSGGSPLLDGDRLYAINGAGVLSCADADSGKLLWQLRLGQGQGSFWSTPVIAGGHLYCIREDGTASVVKLGTRGELVGKYSFGETILASPAVVDGALYVRSDRHLWKFEAKRD